MANPVLRVWEIDMRLMCCSIFVVVHVADVVRRHIMHGGYTHSKARHGEQLSDGGHKIHAVAGDRGGTSRRAPFVLHVDD